MSDCMAPVPQDHPMMVAWNKYIQTPEYANSRKWAAHEQHVDGSLWAAFMRGWNACCDDIQPAANAAGGT